MLENLFEIEETLKDLVVSRALNSMYIDYHKPFVKRIWFQDGDERIYLHKIEHCKGDKEALYHPHPWESAVRIIKGPYEMCIGRSTTNTRPITDCKLILYPESAYEMIERDSWHYVSPIEKASYSLMVTGKRNGREMPLTPNKEFRKLTGDEAKDIIEVFNEYYHWGFTKYDIMSLALKASA